MSNLKGVVTFTRKLSPKAYNLIEVSLTEEYDRETMDSESMLQSVGSKVDGFLTEAGLMTNAGLITVKASDPK